MPTQILYSQAIALSYGHYVIRICHANGDWICSQFSTNSKAWDKGDEKTLAEECLRKSGLDPADYDLSDLKEHDDE